MNIGLSIKKLRIEKKIPQGEFAKQCGISQTSLSQIERGIKRPHPSTMKKVCMVLNIPETIIYLNGLEESDVPNNKKDIYKLLYPNIEDMIRKLVVENSEL